MLFPKYKKNSGSSVSLVYLSISLVDISPTVSTSSPLTSSLPRLIDTSLSSVLSGDMLSI